MTAEVWSVTLGGLIGSGVGATVVGALLARRLESIKRTVEEQFEHRASRRDYERQALFELFGPAKMQLIRTKRAFHRWNGRNDFLEGEVVRAGNIAIRDMLLGKGHLIPEDMLEHAGALIEHYDAWLEEYELQRVTHKGDPAAASFIFVGPQGYPFPVRAEAAFLNRATELQQHLFGNQSG